MIGFQRRPPRWLSLPIGLALALIGTFGMVNSAQADDDDTSWYQEGHVYDVWSYWLPEDIYGTGPGQYYHCESPATFTSHGADPKLLSVSENIIDANITSGLISIAADVDLSSVGYYFGPGDCVTYSPLVLTNDTDMPVKVSLAGFGDSGAGASYFFEWMGGDGDHQDDYDVWPGDIILPPGYSTPEFAITMGMPKDVEPTSSMDTITHWWMTFNVTAPIVHGVVWNDVDDNGEFGDDESLLAGFNVAGQNSHGGVDDISQDTTDSNGAYSFYYGGGMVTITIDDPTKWQPKWLVVNGQKITDGFSVSEDGTEYSYELSPELSTLVPGGSTTLDIGLIDLKPETKQPPDDNGGGDNGGSTEPGGGDNGETTEPGGGDNGGTTEPGGGDNGETTEPGGGDNGGSTEPPTEPSDNGDNGGTTEPPAEPSGGDNGGSTEPPAEPSDNGDNGGTTEPPAAPSGGDNGGTTEPPSEPGGGSDSGTTNPATTNATNPVNTASPTNNTPSIDAGTGGQVVSPSDWAGCVALAVCLAAGCIIFTARRKIFS